MLLYCFVIERIEIIINNHWITMITRLRLIYSTTNMHYIIPCGPRLKPTYTPYSSLLLPCHRVLSFRHIMTSAVRQPYCLATPPQSVNLERMIIPPVTSHQCHLFYDVFLGHCATFLICTLSFLSDCAHLVSPHQLTWRSSILKQVHTTATPNCCAHPYNVSLCTTDHHRPPPTTTDHTASQHSRIYVYFLVMHLRFPK